MTAIIIPVTNKGKKASQYLENLLLSIETQKIYETFKIYIAWDGVDDKFLDYFYLKYDFIELCEPLINRGNPKNFCGNVNAGLRYLHGTKHEDVIVINQDTVLPEAKYLLKMPGQGLTSATQVVLHQEIPDEAPLETHTQETIKQLNELQVEESERQQHKKVTGFCMHLSKELMDKVGYLDEYFVAAFDDDDYAARTRLAGFPVETVNVFVHHYVSKCGAYNQHQLNIRLNQFHIKWKIPGDVQHEQFADWIEENYKWDDKFKLL